MDEHILRLDLILFVALCVLVPVVDVVGEGTLIVEEFRKHRPLPVGVP